MKKLLLVCASLLFLFNHAIFAQGFVSLKADTLLLGAATSKKTPPRNTTEIKLPPNTAGIIYRISLFKKGKVKIKQNLAEQLKNTSPANIKMNTNYIEYALKGSSEYLVDYFLFTRLSDKKNFEQQNDGDWQGCKSFLNKNNSCDSNDECKGGKMWIGVKNNNPKKDVHALVEVVAVIDTFQHLAKPYSYQITNESTVNVIFSLSKDRTNWVEYTLEPSTKGTYQVYNKEAFFKMATVNNEKLEYKLDNTKKYRIVWLADKKKWEIYKK